MNCKGEKSVLDNLSTLFSAEDLSQWRQMINDVTRIVICCHKGPDGDALGSSLAIADYLSSEGKVAVVIVPDAFPDFLQWLPGVNLVLRYDKTASMSDNIIREAELIICMDFNSTKRVSAMQQALDEAEASMIVIDHHADPDIDAQLLLSYARLSSTSEMVFRLVHQLGGLERVSKHFMTYCYTGMMTDTGNFEYGCSYPDFFLVVSYLISRGVDKEKVYHRVYDRYSASCIRFRSYIISEKMQCAEDKHSAYFIITREDMSRFDYKKGDAEGLVNEPLRIKDIYLSVSLREDTEVENVFWVSLRTKGSYVCNDIAHQFFNGGGHANAAGGKIVATRDEAVNVVMKAIEAFSTKI